MDIEGSTQSMYKELTNEEPVIITDCSSITGKTLALAVLISLLAGIILGFLIRPIFNLIKKRYFTDSVWER